MIKLFIAFMACSDEVPIEKPVSIEVDPEIVSSVEAVEGPVSVTVEVWPKESKLGDPITLSLKAIAEPEVELQLPPFGEALGLFRVSAFTPRESVDDKGRSVASQRYDLYPPSSGNLHLPSLRIVYTDRREGQTGEERELLTDEIPISIIGFLPTDAPLEFVEMKPEMTVMKTASNSWQWYVLAVLGLLPLGYLAWSHARRLVSAKAKRNAYDIAIGELSHLELAGIENCDDQFYAALSMIVRRYIESRYGLSAPEQTTEEFLSQSLSKDHFTGNQQEFLRQLLQICDQVKFAGAIPNPTEAAQLMSESRRFLNETRFDQEAS